MDNQKSTFLTVDATAEGEAYKEKGSKFIGVLYPVTSEEEIALRLKEIKEAHHKARHWCYAWQLGEEQRKFRANDDGEPGNSAGKPIYGQIISFDITNILIVVVRYYGGTKLGVGGLINAYKTAAKNVLEVAEIKEKNITKQLELRFEYKELNKVLRIVKDYDIQIIKQEMELTCYYVLAVKKDQYNKVLDLFIKLRSLTVKEVSV